MQPVEPKTEDSRRIALPEVVIRALRAHRSRRLVGRVVDRTALDSLDQRLKQSEIEGWMERFLKAGERGQEGVHRR